MASPGKSPINTLNRRSQHSGCGSCVEHSADQIPKESLQPGSILFPLRDLEVHEGGPQSGPLVHICRRGRVVEDDSGTELCARQQQSK